MYLVPSEGIMKSKLTSLLDPVLNVPYRVPFPDITVTFKNLNISFLLIHFTLNSDFNILFCSDSVISV